ncbi:MAG TPA: sigma-70 family RNA polymerase sigma factor [Polyangia bacterium]|jgi:RNA polymerase sigma-70 factor (ECF subfamily)|nr:sigma-70 family RNA polymerase sigma factor [Polyangia bacterium]
MPLSVHRTVPLGAADPAIAQLPTRALPGSARARDREARLRGLVDDHIDFVARVLRNAGTPPAEIDDDIQRTFIATARRLNDVRPGAEKSFILRIALNVAAHARRTLARRREVAADPALEIPDGGATPEQIADRKQLRQMLERILTSFHPDLRTVFALYEIEEMSMVEIAAALRIPQGTVASRLRRARAEFRQQVKALRARLG